MSDKQYPEIALEDWNIRAIVSTIVMHAAVASNNPATFQHNQGKIEELTHELERRLSRPSLDDALTAVIPLLVSSVEVEPVTQALTSLWTDTWGEVAQYIPATPKADGDG